MRPALCLLLLLPLALAACQPKPSPSATQGQSALDVMERVAVGANNCWIKSGDPAFKAYSMAPELNSFSGKPRILLVRRGSSDIRPLLVVQAEGRPARVEAFGPMMNEPLSARIAADVSRWSKGSKGC
ncbi:MULTISPECIES: hypothetical protein [Alphaproteobacteria]|uniref:Lipoprotein n=2 Tax=Alphaproteobacteria TaxID=28211 RepID=A0A512HCM2_9HYPH|nr:MULTISPECIES: hypothetical protein [Alphaproteobacteria]GEO83193.1 hypothetical protein RNA01_01250 [Ciceribacter naphthalenivorans]GLR20412.1 hypothetical protein GCM10007920_01960 [Ciceribacter naphthalenivorans]GLT03268.1 hypothetical protein GCM10007926_01960 [Sphingomonas psychrolutea]